MWNAVALTISTYEAPLRGVFKEKMRHVVMWNVEKSIHKL